jgi:hypothetical protein
MKPKPIHPPLEERQMQIQKRQTESTNCATAGASCLRSCRRRSRRAGTARSEAPVAVWQDVEAEESLAPGTLRSWNKFRNRNSFQKPSASWASPWEGWHLLPFRAPRQHSFRFLPPSTNLLKLCAARWSAFRVVPHSRARP